ncbi:MAG: lysophospholipid acyltransferase family protein [Mariprofundales bacterium]|nr:lysophospholipid acyltransferase family protein [Mariprofundales bacterium]
MKRYWSKAGYIANFMNSSSRIMLMGDASETATTRSDMKARLLAWLIPHLIRGVIVGLSRSIRWQVVGEPFAPGKSAPFLLCFWHARMLMMPYAFRGWQGEILISKHRDGAFIADTAHLLGFATVRGSTTKGGARALLKMIRRARAGDNVGITPDGPTGPREQIQAGTVLLAMKADTPIRAACYASRKQWRVNSWDRFYIPKPFTEGVIVYGDPLKIAPDTPLEQAITLAQQAMDRVQATADNYFSNNSDPP